MANPRSDGISQGQILTIGSGVALMIGGLSLWAAGEVASPPNATWVAVGVVVTTIGLALLVAAAVQTAVGLARKRKRRPTSKPAEVGAYDFQANADKLAAFFGEVVPGINRASNEIAAIRSRYEPRYPASGPKLRQRVSREEAGEINRCLDQIEQGAPRLRELAVHSAQYFIGIEEFAARPPEFGWTKEELTVFRTAVVGLVALMKRYEDNIKRFQRFMDSRRGDSVEMNAASDRAIALSARISDSYRAIRVACEKAVATADRFLLDPPY